MGNTFTEDKNIYIHICRPENCADKGTYDQNIEQNKYRQIRINPKLKGFARLLSTF